MAATIEQINAASAADAAQLLDGVYEHSPWIAQDAVRQRPFQSPTHLKQAMADIMRQAPEDRE